jgi:hypothetical protein
VGGFAGLGLPLAGFFAAARLGLILVVGLAFLRFIALPRADAEPLCALPRSFDFLFLNGRSLLSLSHDRHSESHIQYWQTSTAESRLLDHQELFEPVVCLLGCGGAHDANSSSSALASFKSRVSNPSVNQP